LSLEVFLAQFVGNIILVGIRELGEECGLVLQMMN
jgi:hypothetical protein